MKKKILALSLALGAFALILSAGTMAYFTDRTDVIKNVFTVGNVEIELKENFEQNSLLLPVTGSAQAGTLKNGVTKEISVKNTGNSEAYVRVHIAIPNILDNGDPSFDASRNVLHFNYPKDSVGANKWDWSNSTGAPYEGQWNYYEQTIDGVKYNVYVVTYEKALAKNEETAEKAMSQVYLDSKVTSADANRINAALNNDVNIKVVAEATQKEGFTDAYDALNTGFGNPGTYDAFAQN